MSAVVRFDFRAPRAEQANRMDAGAAAFRRALLLGYCRISANALRTTARREWQPGETPETTAKRIVRLPADAVHVRRKSTPTTEPTPA